MCETRSFLNRLEYGRRGMSLIYKWKGEKMKQRIAILAAAACAIFLSAQQAGAFPGERLPYRAAHFAHRVAYNINYHVIHPVVHGVHRHLH